MVRSPFDAEGNLYGTTLGGGAYNSGVVYKLTNQGAVFWHETVLYSFTGGPDGNAPWGVIFGPDGSLYGVTQVGGYLGNVLCELGCGTVYNSRLIQRHALSWVSLFCLVLAIIPATAQNTLYENGPINGEVLGWTINLGFFVSDSFTLANPNTTVSGFSFGAWLLPGDVLESAEVSITQYPLSGNTYFDGIVNFTASGCFENFQGFNVCAETGIFNGPTLNPGTYWLNLQNAVSADGNPVYWDMNSGVGCHSIGCPSQAVVSSVGSIPSESFTILGSQGTGTTPEPISLVLFASGALGVVGWIRRYGASG